MDELYRRYRPDSYAQVLGQGEAVEMLMRMLAEDEIPHALLFSGSSGCGKTTLARITAKKLGATGSRDIQELNIASFRGIDTVRDIEVQCKLMPIGMGKARVWIIDEAQGLTKDAQDAFLKTLEDPPDHAYFMLCTTDPDKLKTTIRNRCCHIVVQPLTAKQIETLVLDVGDAEKFKVSKELLEVIVESSNGSGRAALVSLQKAMQFKDAKKQVESVVRSDITHTSKELVAALFNPKARWEDFMKILKGVEIAKGEEESIRQWILARAASEMLYNVGKASRGYLIINAFRDDFFKTGKAGLYAACFEVMASREK